MILSEEQQLIEHARSGKEKAFKKLYELHVSPLFRFLNQFSDTRTEVQDWVQQAFIKAFTRIGSFKQRSSFKTWLWRIAINEMKMDLRSKTDFKSLENIDPGTSRHQLPLESIISMRNEIDKLDARKKMVLLLYEVEGYSHAEIAEMLDVGESTSRTILSRTKSELRESLGEEL